MHEPHSSLIYVIALLVALVTLYAYLRIIRRAGFSGWWILVMFVPVVNLIMLWVFAFVEWPALKRDRL